MTFGFGIDVLGYPQQSERFRWSEINNERITLSFRPATQADEDALASLLPEGEITDISQLPTSIPSYLINVVPELKVNDDVVLSGSPMNLGEELTFVLNVDLAGRHTIPHKYNVIAGSYLAVSAIAGKAVGRAVFPGPITAGQLSLDAVTVTFPSLSGPLTMRARAGLAP